MIVLDIESLSTESTCVILSAAMVYFNDGMTYEEMIDKSIFVKFDAKEQIQKYNRTASKSTLEWWKKQCDFAKNTSFNPSKYDVSAIEGIELLRNYLNIDPSPTKILWTRGALDQMAIESLCNAIGVKPLVLYNQYRDTRTAIDILASTSKKGYCEVSLKDFSIQKVIKHDPRHDCAYDAVQLMYPI